MTDRPQHGAAPGKLFAAPSVTLTPDQANAFAAGRAGNCERHKPAFWWAREREPWKRVSAEIEQQGADLALLERTGEAAVSALALVDMAMKSVTGFPARDWE
jgi:hypothetical protein